MDILGRAKRNMSTVLIIIAMIAGVVFGLAFKDVGKDIKFIGGLFFQLIQMSIIPFVMGQIIEAVGSLTKGQLSRSGVTAIALFLYLICHRLGVWHRRLLPVPTWRELWRDRGQLIFHSHGND